MQLLVQQQLVESCHLHEHDTHVLQFLAFRLSEVKLNCEHLTADLNMTMVSIQSELDKRKRVDHKPNMK